MQLSTRQLATENDLLLTDLFMCACSLYINNLCGIDHGPFLKRDKLAFYCILLYYCHAVILPEVQM